MTEHRIAAQVRAAIAFSGLRTDEIAAHISGFGEATLRRIASVSQPRGARLDELWQIADACGVPRAWFERGEWKLDAPEQDKSESQLFGRGTEAERIELLERYVEVLVERWGGEDLVAAHAPKRRRAASDH